MAYLDHYYRVLELQVGATLEEVNQAYKDLVFIWHPDRIPQSRDRLRQKALVKLQELNEARDFLRAYFQQKTGTSKTQRSSARVSTPQRTSTRKTAPQRASSQSSTSQTPASQRSSSQPRYPSRAATPRRTAVRTAPSQGRPATRVASSYRRRSSPPARTATTRPHSSDLSGIDWQGADLREKDLSGRNLSSANLSNANLKDAFLHKINLSGANLSNANLMRANLFQANLSHANLKEANLACADLSGADLRHADFTGAFMGSEKKLMVKLTGASLAGAIMPNGAVHP